MTPRLVGAADFEALVAHFLRQNRVLDPFHLPLYSPFRPISAETIARLPTLWARPVTEPHWQRVWAVRDGADGPIIASVSLTGPELAVELHRARVAIGVEPAYQRRGFGKSLLMEAIAFASEAGLAWIDLWVFAHNAPAIALYTKLGFVETGRHRDQFRVSGASITDIAMALAVEPERGRKKGGPE